MRRFLFLLTVALVVAAPASPRVVACGNKFFQVSLLMLQRHYAPFYSASILVVAPSRSGGKSFLKEPKFQSALESAGHKVIVVQDEGGVSQALQGRVDLVLVGEDDRAVFEHAAGAAQKAPTVLRVTSSKSPKSETKACNRQFECRLKPDDRLDEYLKALDEAMDARKKAAAGKK